MKGAEETGVTEASPGRLPAADRISAERDGPRTPVKRQRRGFQRVCRGGGGGLQLQTAVKSLVDPSDAECGKTSHPGEKTAQLCGFSLRLRAIFQAGTLKDVFTGLGGGWGFFVMTRAISITR